MNVPSHRPLHEPNSHTTWVPSDSPQPHSERAWPISHPNASRQGALSAGFLVWGRSSSQYYYHLYGPSTHATRPDSQQLLASENQGLTHLQMSIEYNPTIPLPVPSSSAQDIALLFRPPLDLLQQIPSYRSLDFPSPMQLLLPIPEHDLGCLPPSTTRSKPRFSSLCRTNAGTHGGG